MQEVPVALFGPFDAAVSAEELLKDRVESIPARRGVPDLFSGHFHRLFDHRACFRGDRDRQKLPGLLLLVRRLSRKALHRRGQTARGVGLRPLDPARFGISPGERHHDPCLAGTHLA